MPVIRDADIIQSLEDISYGGPLLDKVTFAKAIEEGSKGIEYTEAVNFLTNELRSLWNIDEQVNKILAPVDSMVFLMELSSFLKELGCPYNNLTQGHMSDRLINLHDKRLLLEYLITELMAARIIQESKPDKKIELKLQETPNAANMKRILTTFRFPKPPSNLSVHGLFSKLAPTVETNIKKGGSSLIGTPIFNLTLTDKQWYILDRVQHDLHHEYTLRKEMLLKRLDCTIQSFQWSKKMKGNEELLTRTYMEKRKKLRVDPDVNMSDLISARDDLAIIEKTSSAHFCRNTHSSINRVIIGHVPDRGGRTDELAPPPPEMPSWQQRSAGPGGRAGGGRDGQFQNRGRGRGNFSRGGSLSNDRIKGETDFNRGGNHFNQGAVCGASDFIQGGGNDYGQGGNGNYNRRGGRGNDYNREGITDYNKTGGQFHRGGSTTEYSRGGNDYVKRNNIDYNRDGSQGGTSFDSAGSYGGGGYKRESGNGRGYRNSCNYDSTSNSGGRELSSNARGHADYGNTSGYDNYGSSRGSFDSAGSFGDYKDYQSNEPKRAKTVNYFQNNKTTYADQYLQESEHNQQYRHRDNRQRGGGRSSYKRGTLY